MQEAENMIARETREAPTVPVWDLFVRLFHWTLVGLVTGALVTGFLLPATWIDIHVLLGLTMAALVIGRIIWGVFGPRHARFRDFIRPPGEVLAHLRELLRGTAPAHYGHNPLGGMMILALILALLALAVTGLVTWGGEFKTGPLAILSYATGVASRNLHRLIAWALLGLVALHVLGVVLESLRTRENLARAMVTGVKRHRADLPPPPPEAVRATPRNRIMAGATAAIVFGALAGWALVSLTKPIPGAPVAAAAFPDDYATECGDCHKAYNPTILPAASWQQLMASLDNHFGEDATLDEETTRSITDWLTAHAAESADTKPAHLFRKVDPRNPIAASATPAWKEIHKRVASEIFERAPIYTRSNCFACHQDAADGWYYPGRIEIPDAPPKTPQPTGGNG